MRITRDAQHHEFTMRMPFRDFVNLNTLCEQGIAEGRDTGGFARRVRHLVRQLYDSETVRQPADQPLVILGPGGDYERHWPEHAAELIGGDPVAAWSEADGHREAMIAAACDRR